MLYIGKALQVLIDKFPQNWVSNYTFDTEENSENSILFITSLISEVSNTFYSNLNLSVIEGEYVKKSEQVERNIITIENEIKRIASTEILGVSVIEFDNQLFDWVGLNFAKPVLSSLRRYKHLLNLVGRNLKRGDDSATILDVFRDDNINNLSLQIVVVEKHYKLFSENLNLAKIDHEFKVDKKNLQRLILIKDKLDKTDLNSFFIPYLTKKCNFLIYKIYYRYQQQREHYVYAIDFTDHEINIDELDVEYFEEFKRIAVNHYGETITNSAFQKKRVDSFYKKLDNNSNHSLCDYHAIIKLYKDEKKNLERLTNLKNQFLEYYGSTIKEEIPFNRKAIDICKGYIINNEFSLLIDDKSTKLSDWSEQLNLIENMQDEMGIKNYFPYFKSLIYLENKLNDSFSASDLDFQFLNKMISFYRETLLKFNKKLDWCEERSFVAFQLPFEECIVKLNLTDFETSTRVELNGFLASSFVLPINYNQLQNDIQVFNSNLLKYNTMIEIQKNIKRDKDEIKDLRKTMDNSDKRSIEILSIFSAIVLFVAGDIQLFTKIKDTKEAIAFMLLFAYSLGCFVLLIWFTTRADGLRFERLSRLHNFIILLFVSGTVFCIGLLLGWFGDLIK